MPIFYYPVDKKYVFQDGVPVNAVAGGAELTIADVPDAYVKNVQAKRIYTIEDVPAVNVQSKIILTVASQPLSAIAGVNASGEIEVTAAPEVNDTLTLGSGLDTEVYTFVATRSGANEITISATAADQATNIATAINADSELATAASDGAIATITAVATGAAGNSIVFVTNSLALSLTGEGTLGGGVTAVTADTIVFCKGDAEEETFTFVANGATPAENEIEIGETTAETAANIVSSVSIATIALSLAESPDNTFTVTATTEGTTGDGIEIDSDGTRISGDGVTAGGVDATTLTIGTDVYTFVSADITAGELEINIGEDEAETALNIAAISPLEEIELTDNEDGTFSVTALFAELPGANGNGYVVTPDGAFISGTANLAGGVDEVKSYITIDGLDYIFFIAGGDNPETEYPSCIKVAIGTTDETATNLVTALKLDTANFSNTSVTKNGLVVTANCKTNGIIGNSITYANNLVTAADITDNLDSAGHFIGGIDGTAGYKGQVYTDGVKVWICNETDLTTTNDNWRLVNGSTIYDNGASLAIDGNNGTWFKVSIDTSSSYTFSNIVAGIRYIINIKNIAASTTITITNPTVAGWIYETPTVPIPAGYIKQVELIYNGTEYELSYGALKTETV